MNCARNEADRFSDFMSRVRRGRGCWTWTGSTGPKGYGYFSLKGITQRAHRAAYYFAHGVDPGAMFVCHRCDNPSCVRPSHLFLGTIYDNNADMRAKGRGARGTRQGFAKLTDDGARSAVEAFRAGQTLTQIARKLGVDRTAIGDVISAKTWAHATGLTAPIPVSRSRGLTAGLVRDIRHAAANSTLSYKRLAKQYGVTDVTIRDVVLRKTWKDL